MGLVADLVAERRDTRTRLLEKLEQSPSLRSFDAGADTVAEAFDANDRAAVYSKMMELAAVVGRAYHAASQATPVNYSERDHELLGAIGRGERALNRTREQLVDGPSADGGATALATVLAECRTAIADAVLAYRGI